MKISNWMIMSAAIGIIILSAGTVQAQQEGSRSPEDSTVEQKHLSIRDIIAHKFSDDDVTILITSIEWGVPDRWSFTSRYVHMFTQDRDSKSVIHSFTSTISPGIDGLRISAGYEAILKKNSWIGIDLLNEVRFTWLHTWNNPIAAMQNENYGGIELRSSFAAVVNIGVGYFLPLSSSSGPLVSLHAGVGI